MTNPTLRSAAVEPFVLRVDDDVLDDLHARLDRARHLPASPGRPWSALDQGHLRELSRAWRVYDWRSREAWLAGHPQVLVDLGDVIIHAAHQRSSNDDAPALLVMHGWPHTFAMQLDFADQLPDFHVVVASLPGFAFSSPFRSGEYTEAHLARTMHGLVSALGYERYLTYGEDVTANVNDLIAASYPDAVQGIIVTHAHFPSAEERKHLDDPALAAFFARLEAGRYDASGYDHIQSTRPDTIAAALNDSPVGLLAWITEKFAEWSDTPHDEPLHLEDRITRDQILTDATIYWVTQSIASSFRPYFEEARDPDVIPEVLVPAAVHIQKHEHDYPESAARSFYKDLRVFDRLPEGGHFAVAEVPDAMAERVRDFARSLSLL
ncbi:MAG: Epoxide hydrolase domain protein [Frondihabitans sp.]|nr:Epoxide hydrolase domain protein [Frondihabitans sp.]